MPANHPPPIHSLSLCTALARLGRFPFIGGFLVLMVCALLPSGAATRYVSLTGSHVQPFENWDQAATNIQAAIDVAVVGDEVLVTNGVYATGGKVMSGDLTNRIALDKAITVRSVNGAQATEIWGAGSTNGPAAVRCAWLTNDAVLSGFTLSAGATRTSGTSDVIYGGAVWCSSTSAQVLNCRILNNSAYQAGGGVYRGSIRNSWLKGNRTSYVPGRGGGAHDSILNNCTVVENTSYLGGGVSGGIATNCIVYFNLSPASGSSTNYFNGTILANSCTTPQPSGGGNIVLNPLFTSDRLHLKMASPCRGAGLQGAASGLDIDGRPWLNPPSMGCVEWQAEPAVYLPPTFQVVPGGKTLLWNLEIEGQPPFNCKWSKDGVVIPEGGRYTHADTPNLEIAAFDISDAGQYQVVITNDFGVGVSAVSPLVIHCVDQAAANPVPPFTNWATASPIIQDAIDAASAGEIVLVTNGLYASGGKVMAGNLTNRIAVDKPLIVQSVNGPFVTTISGGSVTNGLNALRCAWVTNGAMLSGFTLREGATRSSGDFNVTYGGGVWCASNNPVVANCLITGNNADRGGGSFQGLLLNCAVSSNGAASDYGGCLQSSLNNSTVTWNQAKYTAGVGFSALTNCIVYSNFQTPRLTELNYAVSTFAYSCTTPLPSGVSNTAANPQFSWGGFTLFPGSPCRGAGLPAAARGLDLFGRPWANPPSMGCAEFQPEPKVFADTFQWINSPLGFSMSASVEGQGPLTVSWLRNGQVVQEGLADEITHTSVFRTTGFQLLDSASFQVVVSNAFGVVTGAVTQLPPVHYVNVTNGTPVSPFSSWATAATNIQDAIDVAPSWSAILVTNGTYATGGRVSAGGASNRICVLRPMTIASVNGPGATIIRGAWDPAATNGPLEVRCAYLADDVRLTGFTLVGGASINAEGYGGGVAGDSTKAIVYDCLVRSNFASMGGGGYRVTLDHCKLIGNSATFAGGGAHSSAIQNSLVRGNNAVQGGGAYSCTLLNSTIIENSASSGGGLGGGYLDRAKNCIIYNNGGTLFADVANWVNSGGGITYSCTTPLPVGGVGNINADPQILDGQHLAATSPCIGAGSALYANGTDLDGQPWSNPPPMGCDQYVEADNTGPLVLDITLGVSGSVIVEDRNTSIYATLNGRASSAVLDFGDGTAITNMSLVLMYHAWTNPGDYTITFTAYNLDHPAGVSKSVGVTVIPLLSPTISNAAWTTNGFSLGFQSQPGVLYTLQQTTNLAPPAVWTTVTHIVGNGNIQTLTDTTTTNQMRFYRLWPH